ncbi:hypothetical protein HDG34_001592 [Paraburkholderia sp. HC6.4b]|uniref:hypothetical protein n=1 Tax=unclassified Paraburkholderia TaxID=2615204 RepID=UPI00161E7825|nr:MULTISPECIES: hypothetical protein [unclassified Paraburkholderia]MBB5407660.1 hypothetical protein [Paraburkholderia sp. HC6.4b]MBB5452327.1 hypothetical protein [Paraburkholderia sp. Kb1A]
MKSKKILVVTLFAVAFLSGCAGTDFVRPEAGRLDVGKSTAADVEAMMGKPYQNGEVTKNGQIIKVKKYAYANTAGEAVKSGVTPARAMNFSLFNNTLVGDEFVSSFKSDSTDFDESKVGSIAKGQTTRDDVIAMLGKPSGRAIYPLIKNKDDDALIYSYTQVSGSAFSLKFNNKQLVIAFNDKGVVSDVEFTSNGDK